MYQHQFISVSSSAVSPLIASAVAGIGKKQYFVRFGMAIFCDLKEEVAESDFPDYNHFFGKFGFLIVICNIFWM